jgi:hypothetical protein
MQWVSVLSIAIGALLGLLSTTLVSTLRHRHTVTLRLLDQYFEVRKAVAETVSDLTHLEAFNEIEASHWVDYKKRVAKLYYQHYDFLPKAVLESLLLLHASLSDDMGALFKISQNSIVPLQKNETTEFIRRCSFYRNATYFLPLALSSGDVFVRKNAAVTIHARHVLLTLNDYASLPQLLSMTSDLRKRPLTHALSRRV